MKNTASLKKLSTPGGSSVRRKKIKLSLIQTLLSIMVVLTMGFLWFVHVYMFPNHTDTTRDNRQNDMPLESSLSNKTSSSSFTWNPVYVTDSATASLQQSNSTVVTAYFELPSKFASEKYLQWMSNMLSLQDAMVIYTSSKFVPIIQKYRAHAPTKTVIVPMELHQVPMANYYAPPQQSPLQYWQHQLDIDPEKRIHRSYQLFWVWLSKSWFVTTAIQHNPFGSRVFVWSDIGCFRHSKYNGKQMVLHPELLSKRAVLQMAHHAPKAPPNQYYNDKRRQGEYFYHSGSQLAAHDNVWWQFHLNFLETLEGFNARQMFVGEDQAVLQSTCLRYPDMCEYIPFNQVGDNHYFGLRFALHYGGNYTKWKPPAITKREE